MVGRGIPHQRCVGDEDSLPIPPGIQYLPGDQIIDRSDTEVEFPCSFFATIPHSCCFHNFTLSVSPWVDPKADSVLYPEYVERLVSTNGSHKLFVFRIAGAFTSGSSAQQITIAHVIANTWLTIQLIA